MIPLSSSKQCLVDAEDIDKIRFASMDLSIRALSGFELHSMTWAGHIPVSPEQARAADRVPDRPICRSQQAAAAIGPGLEGVQERPVQAEGDQPRAAIPGQPR